MCYMIHIKNHWRLGTRRAYGSVVQLAETTGLSPVKCRVRIPRDLPHGTLSQLAEETSSNLVCSVFESLMCYHMNETKYEICKTEAAEKHLRDRAMPKGPETAVEELKAEKETRTARHSRTCENLCNTKAWSQAGLVGYELGPG